MASSRVPRRSTIPWPNTTSSTSSPPPKRATSGVTGGTTSPTSCRSSSGRLPGSPPVLRGPLIPRIETLNWTGSEPGPYTRSSRGGKRDGNGKQEPSRVASCNQQHRQLQSLVGANAPGVDWARGRGNALRCLSGVLSGQKPQGDRTAGFPIAPRQGNRPHQTEDGRRYHRSEEHTSEL